MTDLAAATPASDQNVVELDFEGQRYRMQLPDAATDYIQGKIATERKPYELEMLEAMHHQLRPGDLVIDAGANIGNHTIYLAAVAGCRVDAFEPQAALARAIEASAVLNGIGERVRVHELGLGSRRGHGHFDAEHTENLGARKLVLDGGDVEVITLDSMSFDAPVKALKIDVEGMELDVLGGATGVIDRDRPAIYVECIGERDFREVSRWLDARNYVHWGTFNATPTHQFLPAESVTLERRLARLQLKAALDDYRQAALASNIRQKLTRAYDNERQTKEQNSTLARNLAVRDGEFKELQAAAADTRRRLGEMTHARDRLVAEGDALRAELDVRARASQDALATLRHEVEVQSQTAARQRTESESLLARLHESQGACQREEAETRRLRSQLRTLEAERQRLDERHAQLEQRATELGDELNDARREAQEQSAELRAQRQTHEQLERRFEFRDQQTTELGRALEEAQRKKQKQGVELSALRKTYEQLQRRLEVSEARLSAIKRRAAALAHRNERLLASSSHRIGAALTGVVRSPGSAWRLPATLWHIYRDALQRRAERKATKEAAIVPATADEPVAAGAPQTAQPVAIRVAAKAPATAVTPPVAQRPAPRAARPVASLPADLKTLKVASVMDEFTCHSFAPECRLLQLLPSTWQLQLDEFAPDLVFIESAWRGADDQWTLKVSNPSPEIMGVIDWCTRHGVPSIFWNKEDPAHFGSFLHIARAVDHVFTTDIDCIARYKREVGHDRVWLLPFAAQPATHNPVERFERQDAFCFAGSYYLKYPERQRDFKSLIDVVAKMRPIEIYDRNYHKPHPHYEFPVEYAKHIVGSLPFDQIDKAYKGYRFGINMNTIKQSQTMFARRVFELLASNTIVVSNFSRGVRLLFGDLVVCSDAPAELERRLTALCADEVGLRKFRLAGVRKVLGEHTYAHRLAYIASKVSGRPVLPPTPTVAVLAFADDAVQAERLLSMFRAQTHAARRLLLVAADGAAGAGGADVTIFRPDQRDALRATVAEASWVAPWSAHDHYGPEYLTDLAQAITYTSAQAIGKTAFHDAASGRVELQNDGTQYRATPRLDARSAMLRGDWLAEHLFTDGGELDLQVIEDGELFAIDEFSYCRNAAGIDEQDIATRVGAASPFCRGLSLPLDLLPLAETIEPSASPLVGIEGADSLPSVGAAELAALLPRMQPSRTIFKLTADGLELQSKLVADKHGYIYFDRIFTRTELNLDLNSRFQLVLGQAQGKMDLRTVFEFLDENRQKISHSMIKAGATNSMPIPAHCRFVRFGLRVQGSGTVRIHRLVLGDVRERPTVLLPTSKTLLLTKQYPAYDDLYRYGFVHSRVRAYRREGLIVDVFRLDAEVPCAFREFGGIDVVHGDRDLLDLALAGSGYDHVLVHLLDARMWEMLERHIDRVKVTVWVHGAEIQTWPRRAFEFEQLDDTEIARKKALSDQRAAFWQQLLRVPRPNLSLVFVSRYLADEAQRDLGVDLSLVRHTVIHNFIDSGLFAYHPKDARQRTQILLIRPFASRVYANDLAVRAIELLAHRPVFEHLSFRIVGDGELFEETTQPLAGFANVRLERRFLTQPEIAALHREYGVFLCPTRMDTQGVSRDEAMASGLVPVTTRVAAVPEFVDERCGLLVDPEDAAALATAIEHLHDDPELFLRLSAEAARRVRLQCGQDQTVARELDFLHAIPSRIRLVNA